MGSLVQEAIEFADKNPAPLHRDATPKEFKTETNSAMLGGGGLGAALSGAISNPTATVNKGDDSDLSQDEEEELNAPEDFRQAGIEIREMLLDGMEISDELYIKMFIAKLRMAYEYKDPATKQKELRMTANRKMKINQRLAEIEKELQEEGVKAKQTKTLNHEKAALEEEKVSLETEDDKGWVLVDFPSSYAQAKLLEEALTGYRPNAELEKIQRDTEMEEAYLIV